MPKHTLRVLADNGGRLLAHSTLLFSRDEGMNPLGAAREVLRYFRSKAGGSGPHAVGLTGRGGAPLRIVDEACSDRTQPLVLIAQHLDDHAANCAPAW